MRSIIPLLLVFLLAGPAKAEMRVDHSTSRKISYGDLEDIYEEANDSFENGDYEIAASGYHLYLQQTPSGANVARACYRFALASFHLKNYGRAIQPLQVLLSNKEASRDYPDAAQWLGLSYYHLSDHLETIRVLETFWKKNPKAGNGKILAALADSAFILEDFKKAGRWYRLLDKNYPRKDREEFIAYRIGLTDFKLARFTNARRNLKKAVRGKHLPRAEQAQARFHLGKLARKAGRIQEALKEELAALKLLEPSPLAIEIRNTISRTIRDLSISELVTLEASYTNTFPGDLILLRLAHTAHEKGITARAKAYIYRFLSEFPQHPRRDEAREILLTINRSFRAQKYRLGVLLPLSGSYSIYGKRVLQGVMLATEEENRSRKNKISLYIKDSKGDPDTAAEAVWELAETNRVMAIIGPVLSQTTFKAAKVAQNLACPLITPSAGAEGIPQIGSYIFRNNLTSSHQAHTMAEFAMNEMCINEFAILYPNNLYGKELKEIFSKKIQDLGGKILFSDSYGIEDTDFKEQVLGISEHEAQAIYIPDFYDKVVMIAPQLVFYAREEKFEEEDDFDIADLEEELSLFGDDPVRTNKRHRQSAPDDEEELEEPRRPFSWNADISLFPGDSRDRAPAKPPIQLLGTNGWYSEKLIPLGGKYVANAVFTSGFFLDSPSPEIQRFVKDFTERFGEKPILLSSQAYDATRMILASIKQGAQTRQKVRDNMAMLRKFPGITGKTGMDEYGESVKEIYLLGVRNKKLVQLSGKERWLCKGGEEIDLGLPNDFQTMMITEGVDYEGTPDGPPEIDLKKDIHPSQPAPPEKTQVQQPVSPPVPALPPTTPRTEDDLFEVEDNF